eukprot:scaffold3454_cov122-Isochrysis_galbana.AAC.6
MTTEAGAAHVRRCSCTASMLAKACKQAQKKHTEPTAHVAGIFLGDDGRSLRALLAPSAS